MRRIHFAIAVILCCHSIGLHAQGNVSADPLTGRAIANIAISTITSGSISVPISVSYSNNGVKVGDTGGPVGIGWSLIAAGSVTREMRGLPDDYSASMNLQNTGDTRQGWIWGTSAQQVLSLSVPGTYPTCTDETPNYNSVNGFITSKIDTEPDLFTINAPGLTAQFVFDENHVIRTIPFQDLKITYTMGTDGLLSSFQVTNNLGFVYNFGSGDRVTRTISNGQVSPINYFRTAYDYFWNSSPSFYTSYYNSWVLMSIQSPSGEMIGCLYDVNSTFQSRAAVEIIDNATNTPATLYTINDQIVGRKLTEIDGQNFKATFFWDPSVSQVTSIKLTDISYTSQNVKEFKFSYSSGRLLSIKQEINCMGFPNYQFKYNSSATTSYSDLFGYPSTTATSNVPEVYFKDSGTNGDRFRLNPTSGYSLLATGGSRSVDATAVSRGSLIRVSYPSGGYDSITYEPATYYDALTAATILGGGVRVKNIVTSAGGTSPKQTTNYSYLKTDGTSSGSWVYRPMFAFADGSVIIRTTRNMAPDERIMYSRVVVSKAGFGKTEYLYRNPGVYSETANYDFVASKSLIVRPSCNAIGNLKSDTYTYPFPQNTNYDFERGLLRKLNQFKDDGTLVSRETYTYGRTTAAASYVYGVRYEKYYNSSIIGFAKYQLIANVDELMQSKTTRTYDNKLNDTTKYVETVNNYIYNTNQMLSQTTTVNSDAGSYSSYYKYAKDYNTTGASDTQSQKILGLNNANRHGTLVESYSMKNAKYISAELTMFDTYTTSSGNFIFPSQKLSWGDTVSFQPSTITSGAFIKSAKYYPTVYFDKYSGFGSPITIHGQNLRYQSTMLGCHESLPVLEISNATVDQVAYCDFEACTYFNMTFNYTNLITTDAWSGTTCLQLVPGQALQKSAILKGAGTFYKVTLWAKATTASNININAQINSGSANNLVYPSSSSGKWVYLEARVNMSSINPVNTPFAFQITSSANILVDNVAVYPESADITEKVYAPMDLLTAQLDSRGNASFQEYDALGRVHFLKNRNKDLIQITDYQYAGGSAALPVSTFTSNIPTYQITTLTNLATFTANPSCMGNVKYKWYLDDILKDSTVTKTFQFPLIKLYKVRLEASIANSGSSSTELWVTPRGEIQVSIQLASGESSNLIQCADTYVRHFTAFISGCTSSASSYTWHYSLNGGTTWIFLTQDTIPTLTFGSIPAQSVVVRCLVNTLCSGTESASASITFPLAYVAHNGPCQ